MFGCILENTIENTFSTCCSHFLTFSQLPNEYIISFIPKNTNKTQKRAYFLGEIAIGAISIGEIAIAISPISIANEIAIAIARSGDRRFARDRRDRDRNLVDFDDRDRRRSARSRSREASIARSRSTPIGVIAIVIDVDRRSSGPGEIAIVVRRCGWFRRSDPCESLCV